MVEITDFEGLKLFIAKRVQGKKKPSGHPTVQFGVILYQPSQVFFPKEEMANKPLIPEWSH